MSGVRKMLLACAIVALPAMAIAGSFTAAKNPCQPDGRGLLTRSQIQRGCKPPVLEAEPTCTDDGSHCVCENAGTAEEFVTCGWDLITDCEATPGCIWWQNGVTGDVHCLCQTPRN
jgi:hypothetical protein